MNNYNKYLFNQNRYKYVGIIFIQMILAIINIILIISFFNEAADVSVMILNGVIQIINIISYILFRIIYRNEFLLLNDNGINMFAIGKKPKKRMLKIRLFQIMFFMMIQLTLSFIGMSILAPTINNFKILAINYVGAIVIFLALTINDIAVINKFRRNYFEGIAEKLLLITILGMLYIPSIEMLIALGTFFLLSALINLFIIIKGEVKSDRNKKLIL